MTQANNISKFIGSIRKKSTNDRVIFCQKFEACSNFNCSQNHVVEMVITPVMDRVMVSVRDSVRHSSIRTDLRTN